MDYETFAWRIDGRIYQPIDGRTDVTSYRRALAHVKTLWNNDFHAIEIHVEPIERLVEKVSFEASFEKK